MFLPPPWWLCAVPQIRKMVATAVAVARGVLPIEFIDAALARPCRARTPMARPPCRRRRNTPSLPPAFPATTREARCAVHVISSTQRSRGAGAAAPLIFSLIRRAPRAGCCFPGALSTRTNPTTARARPRCVSRQPAPCAAQHDCRRIATHLRITAHSRKALMRVAATAAAFWRPPAPPQPEEAERRFAFSPEVLAAAKDFQEKRARLSHRKKFLVLGRHCRAVWLLR